MNSPGASSSSNRTFPEIRKGNFWPCIFPQRCGFWTVAVRLSLFEKSLSESIASPFARKQKYLMQTTCFSSLYAKRGVPFPLPERKLRSPVLRLSNASSGVWMYGCIPSDSAASIRVQSSRIRSDFRRVQSDQFESSRIPSDLCRVRTKCW